MAEPQSKHKNCTSFRPGQSGNPGGRPKGESITTAILRLLKLPIEEVARIASGNDPQVSAVVWKAANMVIQNDSGTLKHVLDRTEGPVKESLDVTTNGESMRPQVVIEIPHNGRDPIRTGTKTQTTSGPAVRLPD